MFCNKYTNSDRYKSNSENTINLKISLQNTQQINWSSLQFSKIHTKAAWECTYIPTSDIKQTRGECLLILKKPVAERKEFEIIQRNKNSENKRSLNRTRRKLKMLRTEIKNKSIENYLKELTLTQTTDYLLWRVIKN